jgi:hypothetical protein
MGEDTLREFEGGARLTRAMGTQRFAGGIEGKGSVEWLMCYTPDGSATFVGLQTITGAIGDRTGSIVVQATGRHEGGQSRGSWTVVRGAGTGGLSGLSGEGSFHAPGGRDGSCQLEYQLD